MNFIKTLAVLLLATSTAMAAQMKPFEGDTPALSLSDLNGKQYQLADYSGKVVLVQFWATYCTPCRKEMPSMNRLLKKMDGKLEILAINMGETEAEVKAFLDEIGVEFPVLMDGSGKSIADWKVFAAPSNFVIDPTGKVRYTLFGGVEWDSEEIVKFLSDLSKT